MKRKIVCGIALCLALSTVGCGKSQEQQAADYYQNELGLSEDEANDLAHELYGGDNEPDTVEEEGPIVIEPLPELLDSQWYEGKVQIYDMVFSNDMFMTAEDVRRIVEASEYEVELVEDFDKDGNVVPGSIELDGKRISFLTDTRGFSNWSEANDMVAYGMLEEGEYCMVVVMGYADYIYSKESTEFVDLQTREDVLAYLSANGIAEVSEEQAAYGSFSFYSSSHTGALNFDYVYPNESDTTYANTPHYTTHGAQSITLYRIHELGETDQVMEHSGYYNHETYNGAVLNLVNCVTFEFGADGTVADITWGLKKFILMGEQIG